MNIGFEAKRVFHNKTGLGNYSRDLVRILSTYYPENNYILFNPKKSKKNLFVTNNTNVFEKKPSNFIFKIFKNYWRQKGVVNSLKKENISLYHGLSGELPKGLKKNNIKSIVTIHDLIFERYPELYSFWDRKIHFYKFKQAAKQADLVIAISKQTKKDIVSYLGIDESKIKVIYQGCQDVFKKTYTTQEKKLIRNKFNLPENFILNVGTIEERKNALLIVKAIKNIDTHLVLIGKQTEYCNEINKYIRTNNLEGKVHYLKGISNIELAIIYQMSSIFVYPSIFEGFGIPIIEALYSRTPVITTKSGVFPEAGGPNSVYIDSNNFEELGEKINELLLDKSKRENIANLGLEFVQKFNDDNIATEIMNAYKTVL